MGLYQVHVLRAGRLDGNAKGFMREMTFKERLEGSLSILQVLENSGHAGQQGNSG